VTRANDHAIVMLVDMLGFAAMIKAHPHVDEHTFTHIDRLSRQIPYEGLAAHFINFHQIIESEFEHLAAQLLGGASPHCLTFSDCAYLTMPSLKDAVATAARMMRAFIKAEVPVRIGVGCGTYVLLRFNAAAETHAATYTSQFLGTAVVHAAEARSSAPRGLRILLHESASPFAAEEDLDPPQVLPLPAGGGAWSEVNYANPGDAHLDDELLSVLRRMKETAGADAAPHYTATFEAFNAMRAARGRNPL
jgi:hypothetical protein